MTFTKKLTLTSPAAAAEVASPGSAEQLSLISPFCPYVGRHKLLDGIATAFQAPGLSTVMHCYTRVSGDALRLSSQVVCLPGVWVQLTAPLVLAVPCDKCIAEGTAVLCSGTTLPSAGPDQRSSQQGNDCTEPRGCTAHCFACRAKQVAAFVYTGSRPNRFCPCALA